MTKKTRVEGSIDLNSYLYLKSEEINISNLINGLISAYVTQQSSNSNKSINILSKDINKLEKSINKHKELMALKLAMISDIKEEQQKKIDVNKKNKIENTEKIIKGIKDQGLFERLTR